MNILNKKEFNDFLTLYREMRSLDSEIAKKLEKDFFCKEKPFSVFLGYLHDKLIGFIIFINSYSTTYAKKTCYVEEFYIKKTFRNRGFGEKLFNFLINYANKNGYFRIEWSTQQTNRKAINFYKKYNTDDTWLFYKYIPSNI